MFGITVEDVLAVYARLKGRYDLVLTTTSALDKGLNGMLLFGLLRYIIV